MALATLDVFEEEQTLARLPAKIARLAEHLGRIARLPHVGDVRQCGLIAGHRAGPRPAHAGAVSLGRSGAACGSADYARSEGVLLRPLGNVLVILPPLAITLEQLDQIAWRDGERAGLPWRPEAK